MSQVDVFHPAPRGERAADVVVELGQLSGSYAARRHQVVRVRRECSGDMAHRGFRSARPGSLAELLLSPVDWPVVESRGRGVGVTPAARPVMGVFTTDDPVLAARRVAERLSSGSLPLPMSQWWLVPAPLVGALVPLSLIVPGTWPIAVGLLLGYLVAVSAAAHRHGRSSLVFAMAFLLAGVSGCVALVVLLGVEQAVHPEVFR